MLDQMNLTPFHWRELINQLDPSVTLFWPSFEFRLAGPPADIRGAAKLAPGAGDLLA